MRTNYICSARIGEPRAGTHRTSNPAVSSGNNSVSANAGFGSKSAAQAGPLSFGPAPRHVQAGRQGTGMVRQGEFEFLSGKVIHLTSGELG
jgi:hypothetical protein